MQITMKMSSGSNYELVSHKRGENCPCKPSIQIEYKRKGSGNRQGYNQNKVEIHNPLPKK